MKLEDGYYWAKFRDFPIEVVRVEYGHCRYSTGEVDPYVLDLNDDGEYYSASYKIIEKCNEPKS